MNYKKKTVISSKSESLAEYLKLIYAYKAIILVLAKRFLYIKFAQTILGVFWTILQPLTSIIVYTILFSFLLKVDTQYPYVLFVLSGILFWSTFNYIFTHSSNSLIENQDLLKKMYFPRIILPISKVLVSVVEFFVIFCLFILIFIYYKQEFHFGLFVIIPLFILTALFALGLALILCAITAKKRDFNHFVPFLVNLGVWLTPVFYPVSIIPEKYLHLIYLNPMASIIQIFRCAVFNEPFTANILLGIPIALLIFIIGFLYFKKNEDLLIENL